MTPARPIKPAMNSRAALILALLCGLLGLSFLGWTSSQIWYIYASSSWSRTRGTILESRYIDNGPRRDDEARIRYSYQVEGQAYAGDHLLPGTLAYIDADEEQKVQQYRPGMTANVYYDPQNPAISSLELGIATRLTYIGLIIGLLFTSGAGYIGLRLIRGEPVRL